MAARGGSNRRGAAPALSRDQVVAAALDYIDTHGLEAFSMRNLARELDVYPTALYWHAGSKDQLVADATGLALVQIEPPDAPDWADWLCEYGRRFRACMHDHPNLAPIVGSLLVSNASTEFHIVEMLLAKLHEAGFRGDALVDAYNVVVGCSVGFVTLELAFEPDDDGGWAADLQSRLGALEEAQYPVLTANRERLANRAFGLRWVGGVDAPLDRSFEVMQSTLVEALRAILAVAGEPES